MKTTLTRLAIPAILLEVFHQTGVGVMRLRRSDH
jgi:hypothetical protein